MAINEAFHEVRELTMDIPDEKLEDMYERLRRARFPLDFANDDWRYGYNIAYHRELVDYWIHEYDWRAIERSMNELAPHYKMTLMDIPLHFIRVRGEGLGPMPRGALRPALQKHAQVVGIAVHGARGLHRHVG